MKKTTLLISGFPAALFAAVLLAAILPAGCAGNEKKIVVGAKGYTEQDILGSMIQIYLAEKTSYKIEYKPGMSSNVLLAAARSGDIDIFVDYTGTIYGNYLGYSEMKGAEEVFDISAREIREKFKLLMLKPLGFNNTYTLSVRADTAEKYNLKTYSDLAKVSENLVLGGTFEFLNRNDGAPNLKKAYNMQFKGETAVDGTLRYIAIENDEIQVSDAFSTDGLLMKYNLTALEDDKKFFPPYHAVPVIREETAEKYPEIVPLFDGWADMLTDASMRELNYRVDGLHEDPGAAAREFLKSRGLID
jgi:osmoprotectant transport system permease protein